MCYTDSSSAFSNDENLLQWLKVIVLLQIWDETPLQIKMYVAFQSKIYTQLLDKKKEGGESTAFNSKQSLYQVYFGVRETGKDRRKD